MIQQQSAPPFTTLVTLDHLSDKIRALSYSSNLRKVFIGARELSCYHVQQRQLEKQKENDESMGSIYALHQLGTLLLVGRHDGTLQLFEMDQCKTSIGSIKGHETTIKCFASHQSNMNQFYTGSYDCTIKLWDARKMSQALFNVSHVHGGYVNSITSCNDHVYTTSVDGISVFSISTHQLLERFKQKTEVLSSCQSSQSPSSIFFSCKDGSVKVFDTSCNQVIHTLCESTQTSVNCMDSNGTCIFSGNNQGLVQQFSTECLFEEQSFNPLSAKSCSKPMDNSIRSICCMNQNNSTTTNHTPCFLAVGTQSKQVHLLRLTL